MPLTCDCDYGDAEWWFIEPDDYQIQNTKRWQRCRSCKQTIGVGKLAVKFTRFRSPGYDTVEERIYGEGGEVPMPSWWLCESCGDIYWNLTELGYCVSLGEDLRVLLKEYVEMNKQHHDLRRQDRQGNPVPAGQEEGHRPGGG